MRAAQFDASEADSHAELLSGVRVTLTPLDSGLTTALNSAGNAGPDTASATLFGAGACRAMGYALTREGLRGDGKSSVDPVLSVWIGYGSGKIVTCPAVHDLLRPISDLGLSEVSESSNALFRPWRPFGSRRTEPKRTDDGATRDDHCVALRLRRAHNAALSDVYTAAFAADHALHFTEIKSGNP
jgi:hypothetical protein